MTDRWADRCRRALGAAKIDAPVREGGEDMAMIVRWSPFRELDWVDQGFHRMFDDFGFAPALLPPADVYETTDEFVVELDVPGFEEKQLGIEVTDHILVVKGERIQAEEEEKAKEFRLRERLEQAFERRFHLPVDADTQHVKAKFSEGVLEVHTPKLPISKPHKIEITKA
jgi:HSP20 family protein